MPWSPDPGAQGVTPGWAVYTPVVVGPDSYGLTAVCGAGCNAQLQQYGQVSGQGRPPAQLAATLVVVPVCWAGTPGQGAWQGLWCLQDRSGSKLLVRGSRLAV